MSNKQGNMLGLELVHHDVECGCEIGFLSGMSAGIVFSVYNKLHISFERYALVVRNLFNKNY